MIRPYTVALTGGIASGKTVLARSLADAGAFVIDADRISRNLTEPGTTLHDTIRGILGDRYFGADGAMDRGRVRMALVHDPEIRHRLETLLHPRIWVALAEAVTTSGAESIIVVIPLLAESAGTWHIPIDRILVIDCRVETQIQRLLTRDGLSPEDARGLLALQTSRMERLALADDLVVNEGALDALPDFARILARDYAAKGRAQIPQAGCPS